MNGASFQKVGSSVLKKCLVVMIIKKKSGNDKALWKIKLA